MNLHGTEIIDTHAEAFGAWYARLEISAVDSYWLDVGLNELCGYGTSVIGCDCEIGVESKHDNQATVMVFAFSSKGLEKAIQNRIGQVFLTCPTLSLRDVCEVPQKTIPLGDYLRYFGDGHQTESEDGFAWIVPIMEGHVTLPKAIGIAHGLAGGNLILQSGSQAVTLTAARRAVDAIRDQPGVIAPFPGGICRSGSKVGSQYKKLVASTNEAFCPTLGPDIAKGLVPGANVAYEIIINGKDEVSVREAMRKAIHAATGEELLAISAGSYGGKLGKTCLGLHEIAQS